MILYENNLFIIIRGGLSCEVVVVETHLDAEMGHGVDAVLADALVVELEALRGVRVGEGAFGTRTHAGIRGGVVELSGEAVSKTQIAGERGPVLGRTGIDALVDGGVGVEGAGARFGARFERAVAEELVGALRDALTLCGVREEVFRAARLQHAARLLVVREVRVDARVHALVRGQVLVDALERAQAALAVHRALQLLFVVEQRRGTLRHAQRRRLVPVLSRVALRRARARHDVAVRTRRARLRAVLSHWVREQACNNGK